MAENDPSAPTLDAGLTEEPTDKAHADGKTSLDGNKPPAVVGLGASAGGLQVLQEFFGKMSPESGLAFVVVMHLSPEHKSNLAEIIQGHTPMPVVQVKGAIKVEANHVYVIPPNKHLSMVDGCVTLSEPQQQTGRRVTIDLFFRTLAEQYGQRSVCMILSGSDSDGVIGLKHIKAQGGVTIAQDPTEAEYDSMPRHAIETGMVDWVLPVAEMPARLLDYVRNENAMTLPPEEGAEDGEDGDERSAPGGRLVAKETDAPEDERALREVVTFLRGQTGHDFSHYKRATVLRRIARRLQVNTLHTLPAYLEFLRTHTHEAPALLRDLLICVTHFFRDPESFAALEANIPQLFAGKSPNDQVRVWVPACATGEEAYSIAILLYEQASRLDRPPSIQVFATDLDEAVVRDAREGTYPVTIEADVSPERLRRFFHETHGRYRICKEVRELVLFADHDVLRDSPFSRLDLVSCRNLLIYLKPPAQHRVLDVFHFALRPGGLLFIGGSENIDDARFFAPIDKGHRLYTRRSTPRTPIVQLLPTRPPRAADRPTVLPWLDMPPAVSELAPEPDDRPFLTARQQRSRSLGELHLSLLEQYAPPSVVVDANYDILHLSAKAGAFLRLRQGEPSSNLLHLVLEPLRLELRTALFRAAQNSESVTIPRVRLARNQHVNFVDLHVRPPPEDSVEKFFLVIFDEKPGTAEEQAETASAAAEPVALHLEEELREVRAQLKLTVEQYEASGEELKASNEELQAINEELRSASEELETSKEELQSLNEELTTVNHELKNNLEELSRVNSDLSNLMASTDMATVFLDRELRIKRYTPRVQELFNIIPADIARPISDITSKLDYPELVEDAQKVLRDLTKIEREVKTRSNGWFLARLSPYRTVDDKISGAVVTFINITERHAAQEQLRVSEEEFRRAIEEAPIPIIMHAEDGQVVQISKTWTELTGYAAEDIPTFEAWLNRAYGYGADELRKRVQRLFQGETRIEQVDFEITTRSGERRRWNFSASAPGTLSDGRRFIVGMALDVTERHLSAEQLREGERKYRALFDLVPVAVYSIDAEGVIQDFNQRAVELWGRTPERGTGKFCGSFKMFHTDGTPMPHEECPMARVLQGEELSASDSEVLVEQADGRRCSVVVAPRVLTNERGEIIGAINCFYDITERKRSEKKLEETAKQQEALYRFVQRRHEARTAEDICSAAMDAILAVIECDRASILLLDQKDTMRFVASRGLSDRYRKEVEGHTPWEAKAKNPLSIFITDVDDCDLAPSVCKSITTEGIRALAFIPLLIEDKLIGKFMIYYNAPHVFTEAELNLSQTIAGQTALGIERKQAEESLRQTEERFSLLVEGAKDYAIFLLDPGNVITFWSAGAERLFGWTRAEAEGQPGDLIFTPEDRAKRAVEKEIATALAEGRAPDRRWHLRKDGSQFWADGVMMRLDHGSGELRALVKIARDATEERVAEEALRRARDELERRVVERTAELSKSNAQLQGTIKQREQLERELLEISEREKRRIGEDLHDMVCQELTAAAFFLQTNANKLAAENPIASKTLRESAQIVNRNVNLARELARGLQPMELTAVGLNSALKALAAQASENRGVLCEFKASRSLRLCDDTVALHLYRIAQEAVNNAVKHGQVAKILISVKREDDQVCLQVTDDGKGFSVQKKSKGLGLNLMKYRAKVLGGTWQIESSKRSGTIVTVCVPVA